MALSDKEKKQAMGLAIVVPIAAIVGFYMLWYEEKNEEIAQSRRTVDSLQTVVETARRELAAGSVEDLRQRVADYEAQLTVMRRLVPTDAEVANLIDDISNRAKLRNVHIDELTPMGYEAGERFQIARYSFSVYGVYDDLGGFLSDIASLPRIMVPHQLTLQPAPREAVQALGDPTGSLLRARFQLRTFVKRPDADGGLNGR